MPELPRFVATPELTHKLILANQRWKAGITSTLKAAIEQMEAIIATNHIPHGHQLVDALKAANDGDMIPLNQYLFRTNHYPFHGTN